MNLAVHNALLRVPTTLLWLLVTLSSCALGQINIYERSYNNSRTGANLQETTLSPANVNANTFGKLFTAPTDGQIYAQPLYVAGLQIAGGKHNVLYVATTKNSVYALDADSGSTLWQVNFGTPMDPIDVGSTSNVAENAGIGILGTPVIDPSTNYMYFVTANEQHVNGAASYSTSLNAINILTGLPVKGSPVVITAAYSTADLSTPLIFNPQFQQQRPGLVLSGGSIYIAFGSHGDSFIYNGWVMAYNASTLAQTAVYSDTTVGSQGGIWNSGQAPVVDANGNLYLSTGNGSFGTTSSGLIQTGNSFIKLSPSLQLLDYFTPTNSATLNGGDQDLGSAGLILVPGTKYLLGGGKQGVLYLSDITGMGKFNSSTDQVRQEFQAIYGVGSSHIHGTPVYYNSSVSGPLTYVWGENDVLRAFSFNAASGLFNPTPFAKGTLTAPIVNNNGAMPGGFLSISGNGSSNGIVWASTPWTDNAVHNTVRGVLYAYSADTLQLLWTDKTNDARDEIGNFAKTCPPIVANGKMYIPNFGAVGGGDGTGSVVAYGLLGVASTAAPVISPAAGTYSTPQQVTITDASAGAVIYYTTDGSVPSTSSPVFSSPISVSSSETINALAVMTVAGGTISSASASASYTIAAGSPLANTGWTVKYVDSVETDWGNFSAANAIDGNPGTMWQSRYTPTLVPLPHEIQISLGRAYSLNGFTYLPRQDGCSNGTVKQYSFYVSNDGVNWGNPVASGQFNYGSSYHYACSGGTVVSAQLVTFAPVTASYVRFQALSEQGGNAWTTVAELGLTTVSAGPVFSPAGGSLSWPQNVTITSAATPGAIIHYTTDGSAPTTASPVYTGSILVSGSMTINAVAVSNGAVSSGVSSAAYAINPPRLLANASWTLKYADSQQQTLCSTCWVATNAFDRNPNTFWHTTWTPASAALPHEIQISLGGTYSLGGFTYLPRQDGCSVGTIQKYAFYVSTDGVNWGNPVASGTFDYGASYHYACGGGTTVAARVIPFSPVNASYVRLQALSEMGGNAWTSVDEIGVIQQALLPQTGWSLKYVDSVDTSWTNYSATNAFDGNPSSIWHTEYSPVLVNLPHEIQINLGTASTLTGFSYLPRQDGCSNGTVSQYQFYVSTDGVNWGNPVATGTFNYGSALFGCNGSPKLPGVLIYFNATTAQYIRLRALSEVQGNQWTTAAEINVLH